MAWMICLLHEYSLRCFVVLEESGPAWRLDATNFEVCFPETSSLGIQTKSRTIVILQAPHVSYIVAL